MHVKQENQTVFCDIEKTWVSLAFGQLYSAVVKQACLFLFTLADKVSERVNFNYNGEDVFICAFIQLCLNPFVANRTPY